MLEVEMTAPKFLEELERLSAAATEGPWVSSPDYVLTKGGAGEGEPGQNVSAAGRNLLRMSIYSNLNDGELIAFLRNHADAIAELVRAAHRLIAVPSDIQIEEISDEELAARKQMEDALANLDKEKS
jgi:hypothetical protein